MNSQKKKVSGNPNAADSNFTGFSITNANGTGFRPHDNLRAKLKTNNKKHESDL